MRKTVSTGNLLYNEQNNPMKSTLRPITSNKFRKNSNSNIENDSYNNYNNYNLEHLLLNKTPKQLYDGLMSLKKRVNYLNEEISLAKSAQRKKDVQLSLKNKEIEEYMSDIKMSKDLAPINVNKLKEINVINKLKKEYNTLKTSLDDLKNKKNILEIKLKKSKPNKVKQANLILEIEKRLKILIMEYNILHQNNTAMNKQLEEMKDLPRIFTENHKIIENLKNRIDDQEQTVINLKEQINEVNNKRNLNEVLLDRQKIKNINLNQKNLFLENEIQNRKKISEMKNKYDNKLQRLNERKTELEEKLRSQERTINALKQEIKLSEEKKKGDPHKLKTFNYTSISKLESNPQDQVDSKLILLQSLLDESLNKKKKYQESIQTCIERFKELGYDYSELDKILEENKDNIEDNEENKENQEPNEKKDNNDENNNLDDKKKNDINNNEGINIEQDNENKNNNDNGDNKDKKEEEDVKLINDSNQDILNQDLNIDELNNKSQNKEEQNSLNQDLDEIINNDNNNENDKDKEINTNKNNPNEEIKDINNNNIVKEESKPEKENAKIDLQIPDINNKNKNNEIISNHNSNNNTKFSNISIKDKPETKKLPITNDEFSEFTFILLKNLEAKKINEELARQKIIIVPTKDQMEKKTFIEQMSFNIMKAIRCENKDSLEKVKTWLNSFLTMYDDDQKKMTESFLSLFKEVNIYNSEKELFYSKKIKKYLFKKNPDFSKKLEPYKNKFITFQLLKKLFEEQNIELKDEYSQYLFYELKKFEDPNATIQELKVDNLFKIFENNQNDSKMEEESEIEITNEQYVNIVYNIGFRLINYLDTNKTTLRQILGDNIKNISGENVAEKDRIEVIIIEDFIEKLKEIGIPLNSEIEIYCLFCRYKITDEYGIISINLLEKDLENFRENKNEEINNKDKKEINGDINNINNLNDLDRIGVQVENKDKNGLKVMEKVQEENEDNISNSDNK